MKFIHEVKLMSKPRITEFEIDKSRELLNILIEDIEFYYEGDLYDTLQLCDEEGYYDEIGERILEGTVTDDDILTFDMYNCNFSSGIELATMDDKELQQKIVCLIRMLLKEKTNKCVLEVKSISVQTSTGASKILEPVEYNYDGDKFHITEDDIKYDTNSKQLQINNLQIEYDDVEVRELFIVFNSVITQENFERGNFTKKDFERISYLYGSNSYYVTAVEFIKDRDMIDELYKFTKEVIKRFINQEGK